MKYAVVVLLAVVAVGQASQETIKQWSDSYARAWSTVRDLAERNATVARLVDEHFKKFNTDPEIQQIPYDCNLAASPSVPTSVHELRPGDIKAVGSIGDSITAGFGITATSIVDVILNDRQESWVPGGQGSLSEGVMTVTNVLRNFNPALQGFSYAESWPESREAGLNVAVGGAIASDLREQAEMLVNKMRDSSYGVDFFNDWKLISLFIGGNDLCRACGDPDYYSPANFAAYIQEALDYLYNFGPPRMMIIMTNIFDITPLPAFSDNLICDIVQGVVCSCATVTEETRERQRQYLVAVNEMLAGRYDRPERPDFTVVMMPHADDSSPPTLPSGDVDRSYWSPDCFHPGRKGHYALATSQWNQLFEPVGEKRTTLDWQIGTNLACPTEADPFIKTNLNSGLKVNEISQMAAENEDGEGQGMGSAGMVAVGTVAGLVGLIAIVAVVVVKKTSVGEKLAAKFPRKKTDEKPIATEMESQANPVV